MVAMVVLALAALALLAGRQPAFAADAATRPAVKPRADLVVAPDVQENLPSAGAIPTCDPTT